MNRSIKTLLWAVCAFAIVGPACEQEPGGDDNSARADAGKTSVDGSVAPSGNLHIIVIDDETDEPVPARIELAGIDGTVRPLMFSDDNYGVPLGRETMGQFGSLCLMTGDGEARVKPGRYDVTVQRGIEYDIVKARIDVPASGQTTLSVRLPRAFQTPGWVGGDFHVHSFPSNDADVPAHDRALSMVVEGVEVVVASDHNENFDLSGAVTELGLGKWLFALGGNEVTLYQGHWNIFPLTYQEGLPHGGAPNIPPEVLIQNAIAMLATNRANQIVQLNHPRLGPPLGYFVTAGWNPDDGTIATPPLILDYDSIELLNGIEAKREDDEQILKDWLALLARGYLFAPMGNSDTHHIGTAKSGSPRTYLRVPDDRPAQLTFGVIKDAIRGHHTIATSGPFLDVTVNDTAGPGDTAIVPTGGNVRLHVVVSAANFVPVDRLRIFVNGNTVAQTVPIPVTDKHLRLDQTFTLPAPAGDSFYVVVVDAQAPLPRELAGRIDRDTFSYAIASPVFVDVGAKGFSFPLPRLPASLTTARVNQSLTMRPWWEDYVPEKVMDPKTHRWRTLRDDEPVP